MIYIANINQHNVTSKKFSCATNYVLVIVHLRAYNLSFLEGAPMKLQPLTFQYKPGQVFKHIDGGYYRYLMNVYSSQDQSEKIIYQHVWPFEPSNWERPLSEYLAKFSPVSESELMSAMSRDRTAVQLQIANAKAARRNRA